MLTHGFLAVQQPVCYLGFALPDYLGLHLHTEAHSLSDAHTHNETHTCKGSLYPPHPHPNRRALTLTQIGSCCWLTPQLNYYVLQQSFTSVITVLAQE